MSHRPITRSGRTRVAVPALLAVAALLVAPVVTASPARDGSAAPTPAPTPAANAALDWLTDELDANDGSIPGFTEGSIDWGLTADAVLAFTAAERSDDPAAVTATDLLVANATASTTWAPSMPEVRVAGPTAKLLLVLRSMGRSPVAQGVDLDAALRDSVLPDGPQAGRLADQVPDPSWDASNGFGQALGVLALAMGAGAPATTVEFLLSQQCPSGGFRLTYGTTASCTNDEESDADATALALQALLAEERTAAISAALDAGTGWLLGRQGPDGSFGGTGPTAASNTNSTGLIAQYLRAAGRPAAADAAAGWITSTSQLTDEVAAGTAAAPDVGAIAYDPAGLAAALEDGITAQTADQWRRATSQAVLALGLAPYGPGDVVPLPPVDTTTTTAAPATTPAPTTAPATTRAPTTAPATTPAPTALPAAPSTPGATGEPAGPPTAPDGDEVLGGSARGVAPRAAAPPGVARSDDGTDAAALAATGASAAGALLAGALLLAAGLGLLGATIARRR